MFSFEAYFQNFIFNARLQGRHKFVIIFTSLVTACSASLKRSPSSLSGGGGSGRGGGVVAANQEHQGGREATVSLVTSQSECVMI